MNSDLPHVVNVQPEKIKAFLMDELRMTLMKSVVVVTEVTPEQEALFFDFMNRCAGEEPILFAFLQKEQLDSTFLRELLLAYLRDSQALIANPNALALLNDKAFQLESLWPERNTGDDLILDAAFTAFSAFIELAQSEENAETFSKAGWAMTRVGKMLKFTGHEQAIGTLLTALSCYLTFQTEKAVELARTAVRWAGERPSAGAIQVMGNLCFTLAEIAYGDKRFRLDCFEATDLLMRYLYRYHDDPFIAEAKEDILERLGQILKLNEYLQPLVMLFIAIPGVKKAEGFPDYRQMFEVLVTTTIGEWTDTFMQVRGGDVLALLKSRLVLAVHEKDLFTDFNDWSINYHKLYHVVPHGDSIIKEKDIANILLQLKHELVHVYSLYGIVGIVLNLLRFHLSEFEIWMHALSDTGKVPGISGAAFREMIEGLEPTELTNPSVIMLHFAERSALIERKIQIMEQIWLHWLEGLALFGELVEDPSLDSGIESASATVISNMLDTRIFYQPDADIKELVKKMQDHIKAMEDHYHAALETNGRDRLTAYLYTGFRDYLPGYLLVRKVVRTWRTTLGDMVLRGDQAFRILLHLARFSGHEYIPDLSLNEPDFERAAIANHMAWLQSLLAIPADDLRMFLKHNTAFEQQPSAWIRGRLVTDIDELKVHEQFIADWIKQKSGEALRAYLGEQHSADRISHPYQREFVERLSRELVITNYRSMIGSEITGRVLNPNSVINLGEVDAPFWLIEQDQTLAFVLRDTADRDGTGKPWHDWVMITLTEDEVTTLKTAIARSPGGYLKARRAVILEDKQLPEANSRHFIVLQFEDWVKSYNAGLTQHAMPNEDIAELLADHFAKNEGLRFSKAMASKRHPCAKRTIDWIDSIDWSRYEHNNVRIDLSEWAGHARQLAAKSLTPSTHLKEEIAQQIIRLIFNDPSLADLIIEQGLLTLRKTGLDKKSIINYLYDSAINPQLITNKHLFTHSFFYQI